MNISKSEIGYINNNTGIGRLGKNWHLIGQTRTYVQPNNNLFTALGEALDANNTLYIKHSRVVSYCYV